MASLSLDGHAIVNNWSTAGSSTITLTTTHANDLIVIVVVLEMATATHATVSSISKTGGTGTVGSITNRSTQYGDNINASTTQSLSLEVWSCSATTALTSAVFTVQASTTIDDACISIFGVNYDSANVPVWTTNVACPAKATHYNNAAGSAPSVTGASTNGASMVVGMFSSGGNASGATNGAGYTLIDTGVNTGGSLIASIGTEYQLFATAQSNLTTAFNVTTTPWQMTADAIENPSVGDVLAGSTRLLMMRERVMVGWRKMRGLLIPDREPVPACTM